MDDSYPSDFFFLLLFCWAVIIIVFTAEWNECTTAATTRRGNPNCSEWQ
jgi:hypothetical protein